MQRFHVLAAFCFALVTGRVQSDESYATNASDDYYPVIAHVLQEILPSCRNSRICQLVERFRNPRKNRESVLNSLSEYRSNGKTGLEARSYYNTYGGTPVTPALYPAIDTVSVLASLAFLAFLLHSFASLFDRSRSIIPSVVSNRQAPDEPAVPDPVKLVLRALDEYEFLSNNVVPENQNRGIKTSIR